MSLKANNQCLASDFINLKSRVKAEMQRRCRNGDLSSYAGSDYDYTVNPQIGGQMVTEHVNKIITPINAIADSGMSIKEIGDQVVAMDVIDAKLTSYESESMTGSSSCGSLCSGLCTTGCWSSCGSVCSNSSSGSSGCGSCSSGCSSDCTGGCTGGCSGSCTGDGCTAYCGMSCWAKCASSCDVGCTGGCHTSCSGVNRYS